MPDEYIRITIDNAQAARALSELNGLMAQAEAKARQLGLNLDESFRRASATIGASGNVIRGSVTQVAQTADGAAVTITTGFNRASSALDSFGRRVAGIASGILVWEAFRQVTQTIGEVIDAQRDYSIETARFAAITEQSVGTAIQQYNELADTIAQRGIAPSQAGGGITRIAQFTRVPEQQEEIARVAAQLTQFTGIPFETAAEQLLTILRQTGEPASEIARYGDLIASSFGKIPGDAQDFFAALSESVPMAEQLGTGVIQTYNAILQASLAASEAPETTANAVGRLIKGFNDLAQGGEKAAQTQRTLWNEFNISVVNAEGNLRPIPDLLGDVAGALKGLSAPEKQKLIETVVGGSVKPDQLRTILGALNEFVRGLESSADGIEGALGRATSIIDQTFGQTINVLDARIEQLQQRGDILQNVWASILRGTVAQLGGKAGAQAVQNEIDRMLEGGETPLGLLVPGGNLAFSLANRIQQAQARQERIQAFRPGDLLQRLVSPIGTQYEDYRARQETERQAREQAGQQNRQQRAGRGALGFAEYARTQMFGTTGQFTGESVFPSSALNAVKYSMEEINQAKQMSVEIGNQEIQAQAEFLRAQGMSNAEVQKFIASQEEALTIMVQMVQTAEGIQIFTGKEAAFFDEALRRLQELKREQKEAVRERESSFAFRRLRDVDPSQFGQLQALAQMYNQFLTRIGSPEKSQNINLLLGEQNVFKTLNVRMSALQMALEDLTKVEKAQLAGTWNLPAGATALVPISSLDIQRWNAGQGGPNIDWNALLNAEAMGSDQVSSAIGMSTREIVAAILSGKMTMLEGFRASQEPGKLTEALAQAWGGERPEVERARRVSDTQQLIRRGLFEEPGPPQLGRGDEDRQRRIRDADELMRRFGPARRGGAGGVPEQPAVNVRIEPIRAAINVTVPVMLNGQVIARVLAPILARMFARAARTSANTTTTDLGQVR